MAWRDTLRPNSFRGVPFNVEEGGLSGGRRIALFEFPKRDDPFPEDMGRRARRFTITGYVVGPNYTIERDALIFALEQEGPGILVHQTLGQRLVVAEPFSARESTRRGGMCEIEMTFTEAGASMTSRIVAATQPDVSSKADALEGTAVQAADNAPVSV